MTYTSMGKAVLKNGIHHADAASVEAAEAIVAALNMFLHPEEDIDS